MGLSWLVAAGAATSVGLVAVGFAGAGLSGPTGPSSISVAVSSPTPGGGDLTGQGPTPSSTPTSPEPTPTHADAVTAGSSTPATVSDTPTHNEQQHSEPTSRSTSQPATSSSGSSGSASTEVSDGGTVVADCASGWPRLLSWWPAQEWSAGAAVQGSASNPVASVTFQHDKDLQKVSVTCRAGSPVFTVTTGSSHSDG